MALTQRLAWKKQAKALKEQVDMTRHEEAVMKARVQPWIDKAFTITVEIKGNFTHIQGIHALM